MASVKVDWSGIKFKALDSLDISNERALELTPRDLSNAILATKARMSIVDDYNIYVYAYEVKITFGRMSIIFRMNFGLTALYLRKWCLVFPWLLVLLYTDE